MLGHHRRAAMPQARILPSFRRQVGPSNWLCLLDCFRPQHVHGRVLVSMLSVKSCLIRCLAYHRES